MMKIIWQQCTRLEALEGPKEELTEETVELSEEVVAEVEEVKEEVKEEVIVEASEEEPKPDTHSPEKEDDKKVRFYFPSN